MDWHSRRVLSWRVSNTLDTDKGLAARTSTPTQGLNVNISMDGKALKYEDVYLHAYDFEFYNGLSKLKNRNQRVVGP